MASRVSGYMIRVRGFAVLMFLLTLSLAGNAKKDTELKNCLCFGKIISQANEILLAFLHPVTPESPDIKVTYFSVSRANLLSSNTSALPGFEPPKETGTSPPLFPNYVFVIFWTDFVIR